MFGWPIKNKDSEVSEAAMLAAMFGAPGSGFCRERRDPLEGVDIEAEYALVQKKKSGLSAAKRKEVVRRWREAHAEVWTARVSFRGGDGEEFASETASLQGSPEAQRKEIP